MPDRLNLEIAGINFFITAEGSNITLPADPAYQHFFTSNKESSADIDIRITTARMPDIQGMQKIFDSGESWSLFRSGTDYFLTFQPPVFSRPYLSARMDHSLSRVTIFCSEHLLDRTGDAVTISNPVQYPLDQIILMHYLAQRQGALIHAAGIDIAGYGYIFPGRSGAGKSTLSRQFLNRNGFHLLSDDRIVIRKVGGTFTAYGTPWPGDEGIADNGKTCLTGIFFLSHGDANRIEEISPQKSMEQILSVTSIPWYEEETATKMLAFCEDLTAHMPSHNLQFTPDRGLPEFFSEFVSGLSHAESR